MLKDFFENILGRDITDFSGGGVHFTLHLYEYLNCQEKGKTWRLRPLILCKKQIIFTGFFFFFCVGGVSKEVSSLLLFSREGVHVPLLLFGYLTWREEAKEQRRGPSIPGKLTRSEGEERGEHEEWETGST